MSAWVCGGLHRGFDDSCGQVDEVEGLEAWSCVRRSRVTGSDCDCADVREGSWCLGRFVVASILETMVSSAEMKEISSIDNCGNRLGKFVLRRQ